MTTELLPPDPRPALRAIARAGAELAVWMLATLVAQLMCWCPWAW